jgi:hypothetical protein
MYDGSGHHNLARLVESQEVRHCRTPVPWRIRPQFAPLPPATRTAAERLDVFQDINGVVVSELEMLDLGGQARRQAIHVGAWPAALANCEVRKRFWRCHPLPPGEPWCFWLPRMPMFPLGCCTAQPLASAPITPCKAGSMNHNPKRLIHDLPYQLLVHIKFLCTL